VSNMKKCGKRLCLAWIPPVNTDELSISATVLSYHTSVDSAIAMFKGVLSSDSRIDDLLGFHIQSVLLERAEDNEFYALPVLFLEVDYDTTGWFDNATLASCCLFAIANDDAIRTGKVTSNDIVSEFYTEGVVFDGISEVLHSDLTAPWVSYFALWSLSLEEHLDNLIKRNK